MYIILVHNCVFDYITDCKFNKTCKYAGLVLNFEFLKSLCKYLEFGICFLFVSLYHRAVNLGAFWNIETQANIISSKTHSA
ncbi:hypothetical protein ACRRTK_004550 [Alexandromys fortis]